VETFLNRDKGAAIVQDSLQNLANLHGMLFGRKSAEQGFFFPVAMNESVGVEVA
jgi:hypothetical protein